MTTHSQAAYSAQEQDEIIAQWEQEIAVENAQAAEVTVEQVDEVDEVEEYESLGRYAEAKSIQKALDRLNTVWDTLS